MLTKFFNKFLEYSVYLIVFLLPIQTRLFLRSGEIGGRYSEYLTISLYGIDLLLFGVLILYLFDLKNKAIKIQINSFFSFTVVMGALEFVYFMSIFLGDDRSLAFYTYTKFLLAIGLFWLIVKVNYKNFILLWSLVAGLFFQASLGIWQFLNQSSFAMKWLGMAEHIPFEGGTAVIEVLGEDGLWQRWLRSYGGLDHPNVYGGFLSLGFLVVLLALVRRAKSDYRDYDNQGEQKNNAIKQEYLIMGFLCFLFAAIFFSFSRAAFLSFFVGIFGMLLLAIYRKDWLTQLNILKIILFSGVIFFVLYLNFGDLLSVRLEGEARLEKMSNLERVESYKIAQGLIRDDWFLGVGAGNYIPTFQKNFPDKPGWYYQPVHNVFLLAWSEIGIIGLLLFIAILQLVLREILQQSKQHDYAAYKIPILFSLIVLMLFDHWLWSLHFGVIFFWFVLGFLYSNK